MQVKTKRILISALVLVLITGLAFGGWTWYDNNVDRSGWVETETAVYYKDFHGKKVSGWQEIDGNRYHFSENKALTTGWLDLDGSRYYLGTDGAMVSGWQDIEGNRYCFGDAGAMHTSWLNTDEGRYYLDDQGILLNGWQDLDGQRYYLGEDGRMCTGWQEIDGLRYYLNDAGALCTGWLDLDGTRFYLDEKGNPLTGWSQLEESTYFFGPDGAMTTGWAELDGFRYYFTETGTMLTGWQDIGENRYYLGEDGRMYTGWLEQGEYDYYLKSDGAMAVGPTEIEGKTLYFTPKGIHVVLVNRWHPAPDDYTVDLVPLENNQAIDSICADALAKMMDACRADGVHPQITSGYRSYATQQQLFYSRVDKRVAEGMEYNAAWGETSRSVAVPGTSEHHLGLALDISGASPSTDNQVYKWLAEHCWEYGFILRYLDGKSAITGIYYEPWHVRYVGLEVSLDMKDSGLCLEEYLGAVTQ